MQTDLQLLLLIIGLVFGGFILYNTFRQKNIKKISLPVTSDTSQQDPLLDDYEEILPVQTQPVFKPEPPVKKTREVIALSIIPKEGSFTGTMLSMALKANQFYYGENKMFHRHIGDNPKAPILFSVASLIEPGNFEYHQMFSKTFPGILLWMMLPVSAGAMQSFDKMLKNARQLAVFLNGELCDTKGLILSTQAIATMRERVHQFEVSHEQVYEYEV